MSPGTSNSMMSALSTNNSDSMTLAVPKLHNDGSNWANYKPTSYSEDIRVKGIVEACWGHNHHTQTICAGCWNYCSCRWNNTSYIRPDWGKGYEDYWLWQVQIPHLACHPLHNLYPSQQQDQEPQDLTWHVGHSKSGYYNQEHSIPAWCRGPTCQHEIYGEQQSKSAPCGGQTTLPAHGPATWQSPKDGLNNFWLVLQYNHHVVAPRVVLTDPADDNSCKVHEHPA